MNRADSVKARLKNIALENSLTFHEVLSYYGLERVIYRISKSSYADHFVLKGGILLYAIFDRNYSRATTDADFLARKIPNSKDAMLKVFKSILSQDVDDALTFDLNTLKVDTTSLIKEYPGLEISAVAYLDRTKIHIKLDIGFGDIVFPDASKMSFPTLLPQDDVEILAYSLESIIAEKLEAIVKNGYLNSRYKDFYDIYILSRTHSFEFYSLKKAVNDTFSRRQTQLTLNTIALSPEFYTDTMHVRRWEGFQKKKRAIKDITLKDVIEHLKIFATPLLGTPDPAPNTWNHEEQKWV